MIKSIFLKVEGKFGDGEQAATERKETIAMFQREMTKSERGVTVGPETNRIDSRSTNQEKQQNEMI